MPVGEAQMPVHDAEVHSKVKILPTTPYGCSNSIRTDGYWGQVGWEHSTVSGVSVSHPKWLWIEDTASKHCRYDMRSTDLRCSQCKLPSDTPYLESYQK